MPSNHIIIKLSKVFPYPKPMLEKGNEVADASQKALSDLITELQEMKLNEHRLYDLQDFEVEVTDTMPEPKPKRPQPNNLRNNIVSIDVSNLVEDLASIQFKEKYGDIPEGTEGNDVYDYDEDEEHMFLKEEYEEEYFAMKQQIKNVILHWRI